MVVSIMFPADAAKRRSHTADEPDASTPNFLEGCIQDSLCRVICIDGERRPCVTAALGMVPSSPFDLNDALRLTAGGDRAALRRIYDEEASRMLGVAMRLLRRVR